MEDLRRHEGRARVLCLCLKLGAIKEARVRLEERKRVFGWYRSHIGVKIPGVAGGET